MKAREVFNALCREVIKKRVLYKGGLHHLNHLDDDIIGMGLKLYLGKQRIRQQETF